MDLKLYLRDAVQDDCRLLFEWANDEVTRTNAFNTDSITWEEHNEWFSRMMDNLFEHQYIMMGDDKAIGQIRLSVEDDTAEIDYSIDHRFRGKGYGNAIVCLVKEKIKEDLPVVKRVVAKVKPANISSYQCFCKNGFEEKYKYLECNIED